MIFDGDDTLWETEPLYDRARFDAGQLVQTAGFEYGLWDRIQRRLDVENVATYGLWLGRFPLSCQQAYLALAGLADRAPDPLLSELVRATAAKVFQWRAPPMDDAEMALAQLRPHYRLVLLTQGDTIVQAKRLHESGLTHYFDCALATPKKGKGVLRRVMDLLGIDGRSDWFIGNSLVSDINPALDCGMNAVWVDAHVWEHERRERAEERHERRAAVSLLAATEQILAQRGA